MDNVAIEEKMLVGYKDKTQSEVGGNTMVEYFELWGSDDRIFVSILSNQRTNRGGISRYFGWIVNVSNDESG